ncbi:MAG: dienelactone hydrolase family protein [Betaproteobacteria bacterium]|nr:dienelactone hydrolase family protein [Betaproteobacteria bacterium]
MKQFIKVFKVLIAAAFFAAPVAAAEITGREVSYGNASGYLALPENAENAPALILIHEWWGLNDDIRAKAREFAAAGYAALAADLYGGETATTPEAARKLAGAVRKNPQTAFANLHAAAEYLRALPQTDGARLGSVGWCFGGGWSYQIAKNGLGAKASVIYYGRFNPADDLSKMRAQIIGHFGENDAAIKVDDVRQFQAKLKTHAGAHEIFIYPNAGHGFANPDNPSHDAAAAKTAHKRTLRFLQKHL